MADVTEKIIGMHSDQAFDILIEAGLKWKIVGMNGRSFPTADEGQVPNRVLLEMREEWIETARMG